MASYAEQISRGLNQTAQGLSPAATTPSAAPRSGGGGSYADQISRGLGRTEPEKQSLDDLLEERNWVRIKAYMEDRGDMSEDNHSREDIVAAYVNSMRGFNSGNSLDVMGEMNYLFRGEGEELVQRRNTATAAYEVWDSLEGAFAEGTTFGQKADAVKDYAYSLIADPVNIVSLGVGSIAARASTRTSAIALREMAKTAGAAAAKKVTGDKAKEQARNVAMQRVMKEGFSQLGGQAGRSAGRRAVVADIAASTAVDSAAAVASDAGIQAVDRATGRQEGYNVGQGAMAAGLGIVGGGIAGGLQLARGWGGIVDTGAAISSSRQAHERMLAELLDPKKAAKRLKVNDAQRNMAKWVSPLEEAVERGRFINELGTRTAEEFSEDINIEFMNGLDRILRDGGIDIELMDTMGGQRRSAWYIDTITDPSFPNELYDEINDVFKKTVRAAQPDVKVKRLNLDEWLDLNAMNVSKAAKTMRAQRAAYKRAIERGLDAPNPDDPISGIKAVVDDLDTPEPIPEGWWAKKMNGALGDFQHNFIRMLVTHPGTTALNVVGWSQATAMTSMTDMLRGTLYGGYSVAKNLTGDATGAAVYRRQAGHMFAIQKQKFRNLVDYKATKDEALEYLTHRPKAQKAMFRYMAGGIENQDLVNDLNKLAGEGTDKGTFTKAMDVAQTAYGVTAQDMLTKTQEFMYALDKGIRREYGQSYNEFMKRADLYTILHDAKKGADYKTYMRIEGEAVEEALTNTFARKLGTPKKDAPAAGKALRFVANALEEARNIPVLGALIPFGQFFNNSVVFMADHAGVSFLSKPFVGNSKSGMELALKAAVGYGFIGFATAKEMQNLEEGLAWHEERDRDGKVVSRLYDFPVSFWKIIGRMGAHLSRDKTVPTPLVEEFKKTFGPDAVLRGAGDAAKEMSESFTKILKMEANWGDIGELITSSASMYGSGFTRAFDPINSALALAEGEDYVDPARRIGNANMNNAIRYTDQIIDSIIGLENMPWDTEGYRTENYNPMNRNDMGASPNRQFGVREQVPNSSIGKLFNDIGRPQWQTGLKFSNQTVRETYEKHIFPFLEYQADLMMETGEWDSFSLAEKERRISAMLTEAKSQLKESFEATTTGDREQAALIMRINGRKGQGKQDYEAMLEAFDVNEETLHELSNAQLQLMLDSLTNAQQGTKLRVQRSIGN